MNSRPGNEALDTFLLLYDFKFWALGCTLSSFFNATSKL